MNYIRAFREWVKNASDEELQAVLEPAVKGIECERCKAEKDVYFIDPFGKTPFFYCLGCIEKVKVEDLPEPKSSKGLTLRFKVLARDGFRCVYCGRSPSEDGVKLEVDHVFPKSKGGTDSMDNLVTACWECNQGKKDMVIKEIR